MSNNIWNDVLDIMKNEVSDYQFGVWLESIKNVKWTDKNIILEVPSNLHKNQINEKFADKLKSAIYRLTNKDLSILFTVNKNIQEEKPEPFPKTVTEYQPSTVTNLNPQYTFETFVEGNHNKFARAACLSVAENPARNYNPLFIYGGSGLGKTHLLQAIAHFILKQKSKLYPKVLYVTAEDFVNEFIDSLGNGHIPSFRIKYRDNNVLLIDDIQILIGKEASQESFFHILNYLLEARKQVVISSDRPPKELVTLEERLSSRLQVGLVADINIPDLETREAILRKFSEEENFKVSNDVIHFIASKIKYNIRELKGALTKLIAIANIEKKEINIDIAKKALKDFIKESIPRTITIEDIQKKVAEYYNINIQDMKSKKRLVNVAFPRQIAMYIAKEITNFSTTEIGTKFGKDHATVIHSYEKIKNELKNNTNLTNIIDKLIGELKENM